MVTLIIFDFDGTLVRLKHLHRLAWRLTLKEVGLSNKLSTYLPADSRVMERFDSAARIKAHFFKNKIDRTTLEFFFRTNDHTNITYALMDLKESHLLYILNQLGPSDIANLYANNIFAGLDILLSRGHKLGIISSTRESIIMHALKACQLDKAFEFIIGEESLFDAHGRLQDKPNDFAKTKIPGRLKQSTTQIYYIGDDVRIDSAFARNCHFNFIQVGINNDIIELCRQLEEAEKS